MEKSIQEGLAKIQIYPGKIKKSDVVFYNPEMKINRDISSLAIGAFTSLTGRTVKVLDVMAASGIRGIRYYLENKKVEKVIFNDLNPQAINLIKTNVKKNNIKNYEIYQKDAGELMHHYRFEGDVVDLDPFGSAAYYLEALARCTSNKGLFMVTFTDTAVLSGTYPRTALRRYGVEHRKDYFPKGEIALRVAWKVVAECFAKFDKGVVPLISISHKHYIRLIGKIDKHKGKAEDNIKNLGYIQYKDNQEKEFVKFPKEEKHIGKIWKGNLQNEEFIKKCLSIGKRKEYIDEASLKLLTKLFNESSILNSKYYEVPKITRYYKRPIKPFQKIKKEIEKRGYKIEKAHMKGNIVVTNAPFEILKECLL